MKNEKQFERTIHNLTDAVYIGDANGYLTLYNKAAEDLCGREPWLCKKLYSGALKLADKNRQGLQLNNYLIVITHKQHQPLPGTEVIIKRQDGNCRQAIQYASTTFYVLDHLTSVIVRDIEVIQEYGMYDDNKQIKNPILFG